MTEANRYELIIIGGGPAGLAAGLYAARARMKTVCLERLTPGGALATTEDVENYPGLSRAPTSSRRCLSTLRTSEWS